MACRGHALAVNQGSVRRDRTLAGSMLGCGGSLGGGATSTGRVLLPLLAAGVGAGGRPVNGLLVTSAIQAIMDLGMLTRCAA